MQILKDRLDELLEKAVEGAAVAGNEQYMQ